MSANHIARAAERFTEIVRNVKPDQLAHPTPCTDFDVRGLVNHLLFWGPPLLGAARREQVPPPAESESDVDLVGEGWAADLVAYAERTAAAWGKPAAWTGTTHMGGPMELPAELVGGMVAGELVVHGWDLARATGQRPEWDEDVLRYVYDGVVANAEQGRELGAYGPEVPVPATASTLDKLLGASGRDPKWTVD
jgi:uncharacterized protein (TIGR03086 family)